MKVTMMEPRATAMCRAKTTTTERPVMKVKAMEMEMMKVKLTKMKAMKKTITKLPLTKETGTKEKMMKATIKWYVMVKRMIAKRVIMKGTTIDDSQTKQDEDRESLDEDVLNESYDYQHGVESIEF